MKDNGSRHACPEGNRCAPSPIGDDAKGNHHQNNQGGDFENVQDHAPEYALAITTLPEGIPGGSGRFESRNRRSNRPRFAATPQTKTPANGRGLEVMGA
jgi:hypothetical protein